MTIRNRRRYLLAVSVGCLAVGLGEGAAYAWFTASGSGSGGVHVTSLTNTVTLETVTVAPKSPLLPGGTGSVVLQVSNHNNFSVTLAGVVRRGTITASPSDCATGVAFTDQPDLSAILPASSTTLAPGSSTTVELPGVIAMDKTSPSDCQGAKLSIPVQITVRK
jgi:hypothetical protein